MNDNVNSSNEISETFKTKLMEMKWAFFSVLVNFGTFLLIILLIPGFSVPLSEATATSVGCVFIVLLFILSNILTAAALDSGASA